YINIEKLKEKKKHLKSYIIENASKWKKKIIKTAEKAYQYAKKVKQPKDTHSNQVTKGKYKPKQLVSREMTPKWLEERDNKASNSQTSDNNVNADEDETLKRDREALLKRLNSKREEE